MQIGIIGFGRMGKLLSRYLAPDFEVLVSDTNNDLSEAAELDVRAADLSDVLQAPALILAVPMSAMESVLLEISPQLKPGTLVLDICSVKQQPVMLMQKHLPEHVEILATHPMFGPDSAAQTLYGAKLVLCPVRIEEKRYQEIKAYLNKNGLNLIETSPEEHDRQIATSLFLPHLIGRTLIRHGADKLAIDTKGYRRLLKILLTVQNDTWQLFEDMYHLNAYAKTVTENFVNDLEWVLERLK